MLTMVTDLLFLGDPTLFWKVLRSFTHELS